MVPPKKSWNGKKIMINEYATVFSKI